jgi:hypothetical protein
MSTATPGSVGPPDTEPPTALVPRSTPAAVAARAAQSSLGSGSVGQAVTIVCLLSSGSSAPRVAAHARAAGVLRPVNAGSRYRPVLL